MKRIFLLPILLLALTASARTGKVPFYKSFVYWIQNTDTLYSENNTLLQESVSPDGTVIIRVRHEDWQDIVTPKSIKRMAPWHAAVSQRHGIRAILHQERANTDAMMPMKQVPGMMPNALGVNNLSKMTDQLEMHFTTEYMIENAGTQEMIINDLNRGLVWYVPPKSYLLLNMGELPQACLLRIASTNASETDLKYVTIGSACYTMKFTIAYEDDDCWIFLLNEEAAKDESRLDFSNMLQHSDYVLQTRYVKRDKDTFVDTPMVEEEVFAIIKQSRAEKSKK